MRRPAAIALALVAAALLGDAGWIHAKAWLAQALMHEAWAASRADGGAHKPWPWADTHPVARLRVPRLGVDQIVLAGDSGRVLAFGPGWAPASAPPGTDGTTILSGHRDTSFAWLRELRRGDALEIETKHGVRQYLMQASRIVDSRSQRLALDADGERLQLVTCWPFDAVRAGGPLRYVVTATPTPP